MKMRPFSPHSSSTLSGASASDEQVQIGDFLRKIETNIRTVTSYREQIAGVLSFLLSPETTGEERQQASDEWHQLIDKIAIIEQPAIESARRNAQQLATYLMVASHMPSSVGPKLKEQGDRLLDNVDRLQTTWGNYNLTSATASPESSSYLAAIQGNLKTLQAVLKDWSTVGYSSSNFGKRLDLFGGGGTTDPLPSLTPSLVCRNLSPALQAWYAKDGADCASLPPIILAGIARCSVTGKAYDQSTDACIELPSTENEKDWGNHKEPTPGDRTESEGEESSVVPWLVGAAAVAAGIGWFVTRKKKST